MNYTHSKLKRSLSLSLAHVSVRPVWAVIFLSDDLSSPSFHSIGLCAFVPLSLPFIESVNWRFFQLVRCPSVSSSVKYSFYPTFILSVTVNQLSCQPVSVSISFDYWLIVEFIYITFRDLIFRTLDQHQAQGFFWSFESRFPPRTTSNLCLAPSSR